MLAAQLSDKCFVDDLTQEFLLESGDGLDRMERCLLQLESCPNDPALLGEIFRAVHTIKGTTGFLAFPRLEKLSHAGEHLLSLLRDGRLQATRRCIDGLLALLDGLRRILQQIEVDGTEGCGDPQGDEALLGRLDALRVAGDPAAAASKVSTEKGDVSENSSGQQLQESTLRVEVETLNQMLNLVGELVLTRNQISLHAEDENAVRRARRLDAVTTDLRETMMRARTQPVGQLFARLPRMVRDLADRLGRCVRLELAGQETRLDKTLLDALRDPLLHVLRNAVDHGVEAPAERVRRGKALEATLRVAAYQEGGQVVIEVCDDGGGIDPANVKARALSRGLITHAEAASLSPAAAARLIFLPGFSTRDEVSITSGRGVGMDIVRSNVEGLGGTVELESTPGEGTKIRMRVPLTLAIIPALVVRSGGCNFAFPRADIRELMVVSRAEEASVVQRMGDAFLLRVRERLVPLFSLCETLRLQRNDERGYYVLVLEAQGQTFGVIVDDVDDQQEIVVKPLPRVFGADGLFSGASVLGNGELALIMDVAGLADAGRIRRSEIAVTKQTATAFATTAADDSSDRASQLLVYESQSGERSALRLAEVERVEKIAQEQIEPCDGRALVQHGGGMIELEGFHPAAVGELSEAALTVVVCKALTGGHKRGVVVRRVLDIAPATAVKDNVSDLALVRGRVVCIRADAGHSVSDLREAA